MTIEAQIVADSISPAGIRLTTFQLRYPRFIHAELMTHRMFSRNASSSRAIPVKKMIEDLRRDPAMPVYWGSNKPGMQAGEEIDDGMKAQAKQAWLDAMEQAIEYVEWMTEVAQLHKQIANRILEPWAHINVVVTATDWENFYTLRRHKDAQPELKALADAMHRRQKLIAPTPLRPGEWHLPYCTRADREAIEKHLADHGMTSNPVYDHLELLKRISVARCARVSYLTHDGKETTVEEDLTLYDRLVGAQPLHASPAEHQATPDEYEITDEAMSEAAKRTGHGGWEPAWQKPEQHGNLRGWIQLRKTLAGEYTPG